MNEKQSKYQILAVSKVLESNMKQLFTLVIKATTTIISVLNNIKEFSSSIFRRVNIFENKVITEEKKEEHLAKENITVEKGTQLQQETSLDGLRKTPGIDKGVNTVMSMDTDRVIESKNDLLIDEIEKASTEIEKHNEGELFAPPPPPMIDLINADDSEKIIKLKTIQNGQLREIEKNPKELTQNNGEIISKVVESKEGIIDNTETRLEKEVETQSKVTEVSEPVLNATPNSGPIPPPPPPMMDFINHNVDVNKTIKLKTVQNGHLNATVKEPNSPNSEYRDELSEAIKARGIIDDGPEASFGKVEEKESQVNVKEVTKPVINVNIHSGPIPPPPPPMIDLTTVVNQTKIIKSNAGKNSPVKDQKIPLKNLMDELRNALKSKGPINSGPKASYGKAEDKMSSNRKEMDKQENTMVRKKEMNKICDNAALVANRVNNSSQQVISSTRQNETKTK